MPCTCSQCGGLVTLSKTLRCNRCTSLCRYLRFTRRGPPTRAYVADASKKSSARPTRRTGTWRSAWLRRQRGAAEAWPSSHVGAVGGCRDARGAVGPRRLARRPHRLWLRRPIGDARGLQRFEKSITEDVVAKGRGATVVVAGGASTSPRSTRRMEGRQADISNEGVEPSVFLGLCQAEFWTRSQRAGAQEGTPTASDPSPRLGDRAAFGRFPGVGIARAWYRTGGQQGALTGVQKLS